MEPKEFKSLFYQIAKIYGFEIEFSAAFKESPECLFSFYLQKSNYGKIFYLIVKIFVQGAFGKKYIKSKSLLTQEPGNFFRGQPKEFESILNLETLISKEDRIKGVEKLFQTFIIPLANKATSIKGIKELVQEGKLPLLPAIKEELGI